MTPLAIGPSQRPAENTSRGVLCAGPISIDQLVFESNGRELRYPSGNGVITSSIVAAMGVATSLAGSVGDDASGREIRGLLRSHGVDVSDLQISEQPTKVAKNIVSLSGEWRRESAEPAVVPYLSGALPRFERSTHLYVGGLNGMLRSAPDATRSLIEDGRRSGLRTNLGLARANFDAVAFNSMIADGDILFCNAFEFRSLTATQSEDPESLFAAMLQSRFRNCVVTMGPRGALASLEGDGYYVSAQGSTLLHARISVDSERERLIEGLRREPPVATTAVSAVGAGDVFAGVFLAAQLTGCERRDALRAAAKAASLSVNDTTWDAWLTRAPDIATLIGLAVSGSS